MDQESKWLKFKDLLDEKFWTATKLQSLKKKTSLLFVGMPLDTLDEGTMSGCSEEKIIILTLSFYKSCRRMKGVIFRNPLLWHASKGGFCYLELTLVARSGSEDLGGSIFYLLRSRGDEGRSKCRTSLEESDAIFAFPSYVAEN